MTTIEVVKEGMNGFSLQFRVSTVPGKGHRLTVPFQPNTHPKWSDVTYIKRYEFFVDEVHHNLESNLVTLKVK